jgi:hypothetical protein
MFDVFDVFDFLYKFEQRENLRAMVPPAWISRRCVYGSIDFISSGNGISRFTPLCYLSRVLSLISWEE